MWEGMIPRKGGHDTKSVYDAKGMIQRLCMLQVLYLDPI